MPSLFTFMSLTKQLGLVALYVLMAKLTLLLFGNNMVVEFLWPASGVALAVVLIGGNKYLPAVFLGGISGYLLIGEPLGFSAAIALFHATSIFICTWALKREGGLNSALLTPSDFFRILILATIVGLIWAVTLNLLGWLDAIRLADAHTFLQHWVGSLLGIIVTLSLTLVWSRLPRDWATPAVAVEVVLILSMSILVGQVVFVGSLNDSLGQIARGYWLFPLITLAAVRIGRHGTVLIVAIVAAQGLVGAAIGVGFFANDIENTHLANYFFYTLSLAVVDMALATYISERKSALAEVKYHRDDLKLQVMARTDELVQQLNELSLVHSKLKNSQAQLLQSEKMASIGQLAAGVAHEVNNPIGFVHSNLGSLSRYVDDLLEIIDCCEKSANAHGLMSNDQAFRELCEQKDLPYIKEDIRQLLAESKDGTDRVRRIVQNLKDFSHVSEDEWQWTDLHTGIDSTLTLVWNEIKYKADLHKEYGNLPNVFCLASQINQVIMNLLVNAAQAIETHGTITINTGTLEATIDAGQRVWIEITDTGMGIPAENLKQIFDPFFTTKPVGKGTGLGLSIAWGIRAR